MNTTPIQDACRLLREGAAELKNGHTLASTCHDWTGEPEAKAAYDEHMAAADALERLQVEHATLQAGYDAARLEIESLRAAHQHAQGNVALLADILNRRPAMNHDFATYADWSSEVYNLMGAMAAEPANDADRAARAQAAPGAPESTPMPETWHVTAHVHGEPILSIGYNWLSGKGELSEEETAAVIGMAQHLLSFVGYGLPPSSFDPDADDATPAAPAPGVPSDAPVGRTDGDGHVTWFAPIPEGGANLYARSAAGVTAGAVAAWRIKDAGYTSGWNDGAPTNAQLQEVKSSLPKAVVEYALLAAAPQPPKEQP